MATDLGWGWYDKQPDPGLFRSIRPAWNDLNLLDLAAHIESPLFMAHVRATSLATIQETNCHPFRYKQWLFVHNGQIAEFQLMRQALLLKVAPEYFGTPWLNRFRSNVPPGTHFGFGEGCSCGGGSDGPGSGSNRKRTRSRSSPVDDTGYL